MSDVESLSPENFEIALKSGPHKVWRSSPNGLLLDLDTIDRSLHFDVTLTRFRELYHVPRVLWWVSKSGLPHRHVIVSLGQPIDDAATRYGLQAVLGSDPVKEMLSLTRLAMGMEEPSLLFQPIDAELHVVDFGTGPALPECIGW